MPDVGEIRKGKDIGKRSGQKYIWAACPDCGKERWVGLQKNLPESLRCQNCHNKWLSQKGDKHPNWKGGRHQATGGYILIYLEPSDFFYSMTGKRGYIYEHRLVMAKHLGRNLHPWEIVHHKHTRYPAGTIEDKQDNRIENLQLVSDDKHKQISILENKIVELESKVRQQGNQIKLLQWRLKEMEVTNDKTTGLQQDSREPLQSCRGQGIIVGTTGPTTRD